MSKPKVLLSAALSPDLLAEVEAVCEVVANLPSSEVLDASSIEKFSEIEGWLTTVKQPVTAEILERLPRLRAVSNYAVGYDNIDVEAGTQRRVQICNTPGVLDAAVAEATVGMILSLVRGLAKADRFVRDGAWQAGAFPLTVDVHGKRLGIVGHGRIGRRVATVAAALGMEIVYHNRRELSAEDNPAGASLVSREELLTGSDVVVLLLPLNEDTRGSFGAKEFEQMKDSAYLINPARGALIDEDALTDALRSRSIAGAALDVMTVEPLAIDSPLLELDNTVLLPHIGSATVETRRAMAELAVHNLLDAVRGEHPRGAVNDLAGQ